MSEERVGKGMGRGEDGWLLVSCGVIWKSEWGIVVDMMMMMDITTTMDRSLCSDRSDVERPDEALTFSRSDQGSNVLLV